MSLNRESRFLVILGSIVFVAAVALAVLMLQARGKYTTVSAEYDRQAAELKRLQSLAPYPDQANLDKVNEQVKTYSAAVGGLLGQLGKLNIAAETVSPNQFQDRLREVVSAINERAEARGTKLPEKFYLGYDPYQDSLPRPEAAAPLARQLKGIEILLNTLIDARVAAISGFQRTPIPEEAGVRPATAGGGEKGDKAGPALVTHQPLTLSFTSEAGQLRQVLNEILRAKQYFLVRSFKVKNEAEKGPPRNIEDVLAATPQAGVEPGEVRRLQFIVGKEKLQVDLRIELVNFGPAELADHVVNPPAEKPAPATP